MPDPKVIDPSYWQYYRLRNPPREWYDPDAKPRSLAQLHTDINEASDRLRKQMRVNDYLWHDLQTEKRKNFWLTWAIGLLWPIVLGLAAFIGWCAANFGPFILKGMRQ